MIGYLTGSIISKKPTQVLLDVNGVGYVINISINTFERIPETGEKVSLHTYLAVREDSLTLFGFSSEPEKQMFELLIGVNGIGPKLAQSVLSGIQIEELKHALKTGNLLRLVAVPGIGRKTAERMLLDLREKVDNITTEEFESSVPFKIKDDAIAALATLGYNQKMAERVIRDILLTTPTIKLEELIRQALSQLNK
ncbi:MAG: Holliday junction branch migration protein RuvA [Bacteroidota bacterium]|nr:Holliday junction branch migration protein RuvA [Bacteroidota bacterium]MDP4192575.1 Holliday junction branch migration protein RuvA [Bacteroidota bacterium]MDP4196814.1 Holliday junction branch migration protein RuvA [Bacteroidota bacterium]